MAKAILKTNALKDNAIYFVGKTFNADVGEGEIMVLGGKCYIASQVYKAGTTDATLYTGGIWQVDTTEITGTVAVGSALYIDSSGDFTMTSSTNMVVGAVVETSDTATYVYFY